MPLTALFGGAVSWRVLSIAAALLLIGAVYAEAKYIGHLKSRLESAEQVARENAAATERAQQEYQRVDAIASRVASDAQRRRRRYELERTKIANISSSQDGALAPVLRSALDRLPEQTNAVPGNRSPDVVDP